MPDVAARSTHSLSLPIPLDRARVPDLGAVPHRLILPPRDSAGANGGEAPGDLHSSGARRSRCVLGRTEEAARQSSTSVVESSRRTPLEFEKTIAVIFLPG